MNFRINLYFCKLTEEKPMKMLKLKRSSEFYKACDRLSFRLDFYSKPDFYGVFIDLWDKAIKNSGLESRDFIFDKLNLIQQNMVNIDAVAEALNTTIDNVLDSKSYIFDNILNVEESEANSDVKNLLFVNPYCIHFYTRNLGLHEDVIKTCSMLYSLAIQLWQAKKISIADIYLNVGTSEILDKGSYLSMAGFGGYKPVGDPTLCNQMSTSQFVDNGFRCIVKNYLSLLDVTLKEDETTEQMWYHVVSADYIHYIDGEETVEGFSSLFNKMLEKCQNYIESVCAK